MRPPLFRDRAHFTSAFADGLQRLTDGDTLGGLILALANARSEQTLWDRLAPSLEQRYSHWLQARAQGGLDAVPPDDRMVFDRLAEIGFDALQPVAERAVGPWRLQFNQLRSFRPPRMSDAVVSTLHTPFNPDGFHFNKPFLRPEILWQGDLAGHPTRWLYNKFPFAPLHTLLVIEPHACHPQWLTPDMHHTVWDIAAQLGEGLPGLGFGYNAYGAFSSVNHLHFQGYVGDATHRFPVEAGEWAHNGGEQAYPVACERHDTADSAWQFIEQLHRANTPYNLLYRPGQCYVLPRAFQGGYRHSDWTTGFAWAEMAGAFTLFDAKKMAALGGAAIAGEFALLRA